VLNRIPCAKSKELAIKYGVYEQLAPLIDFDLTANGSQNGEEAYLTKEQALVARKKITGENASQVKTNRDRIANLILTLFVIASRFIP
jgi:hypothetical protein